MTTIDLYELEQHAREIQFLSDVLDDAEDNRLANENRLRQLLRPADQVDADGAKRGFGLSPDAPQVVALQEIIDSMRVVENKAVRDLERRLRAHPLGPWIKSQKGVGDKQAGRLIGAIGDPYIRDFDTGQARSVSQLWAFCGHGKAMRRRAGMSQDEAKTLGNPKAKSRTWLIANSILRGQGPLTRTYYERREVTIGRTHATECVRCGPSGKPAQPGSPWSDGHAHADGLRVLGKEMLRLMWLEARRIHTGQAA